MRLPQLEHNSLPILSLLHPQLNWTTRHGPVKESIICTLLYKGLDITRQLYSAWIGPVPVANTKPYQAQGLECLTWDRGYWPIVNSWIRMANITSFLILIAYCVQGKIILNCLLFSLQCWSVSESSCVRLVQMSWLKLLILKHCKIWLINIMHFLPVPRRHARLGMLRKKFARG